MESFRQDVADEAVPQGAARVDVCVENLSAAIRRSGLSRKEIAHLAPVSDRVISTWSKSARASFAHLRKVARVLECSTDYLRGIDQSDAVESVRRIDGTYELSGGDLELEGHFQYDGGIKSMSGEMEIWHESADPRRLRGKGQDRDGDEIEFRGKLYDNQIVRGDYEIANERMSLLGSVVASVKNDGATIAGYYLGRASGHAELPHGLAFGHLTLSLIAQSLG